MKKFTTIQTGKNLLMAFLLGLTMMATTGCSGGGDAASEIAGDPAATADEKIPFPVALTDDLLYVYELQKAIKDVYDATYDMYESYAFSTISGVEQQNIDDLEALFISRDFDFEAVSANTPGVYQNPLVQEMYDTFIAEAAISELYAVDIGIITENQMIDLSQTIIDQTDSGTEGVRIIMENFNNAAEGQILMFEGWIQRYDFENGNF